MATDYGTDLSCVSDIDPTGALVSGPLLVGQAVMRRWSTPRGRLGEDPNYGFNVPDYLNDDTDAAGVAQIATGMIAEAKKDERVLDCDISTTPPPAGAGTSGTYTFEATLYLADGPFTLVLTIDSVSVTLLETQG